MNERTNGEPGPPRAPRWVKVSAVVAIVVVVLVVLMLVLGGEHGPGRHSGGSATPSDVLERHAPPPGAHA